MIQAGLLAASLLAVLPVQIEAGACPSQQDIERRLEAMLGAATSAVSTPANVARISFPSGGPSEGVQIQLTSPDGAMIAERSLPYSGSCADLADLVAVVLASWESDIHPEFTRPEADIMPPAGVIPQRGAGARRASALDVSAGAGISQADSAALGGSLALTWFPWTTGLGLRISGMGETAHTVDIGGHQAQWRRFAVGAELDWRAGTPASLDLRGGLALAVLGARGLGFDQNSSDSSLGAALVLGARVSLWLSRRWAVYADVAGSYCGRSQKLRGSDGTGVGVPSFQGLLSLGVAARLFRAIGE